MKSIDFTKPGGFPLTQDQLGFLQTEWTEVLQGIVAAGNPGSAAPYIISGCVITATLIGGGPLYTLSNTAGWIYYQGNIIKVVAGSVGINPFTSQGMFLITPADSTLTYNDGSTPTVIFDNSAALTAFPYLTADDGTKFLWSELIQFGVGFGANNRGAFETITVTGLGAMAVNATIKYKKNYLSNSLVMNAAITVTNPSGCTNIDQAPLFTTLATLPAGFMPTANAPFEVLSIGYNIWPVSGGGGVNMYLNQLTGYVDTAGNINIQIPLPVGSPASYPLWFNCEIPLD